MFIRNVYDTSLFAALLCKRYNTSQGDAMSTELRIIPVSGIGEVPPGADLGHIIFAALQRQHLRVEHGDVFIVTQKIVSKAEGRVIDLAEIEASEFAQAFALEYEKDPQHVEVVLRESKRIVRMDHGVLISETRHGFICANAGVDESNVNGRRELALLPIDPDRSAQELRTQLRKLESEEAKDVAVIISDTWGRPWRNGQVNMAIGVAGMEAIIDYRGQLDPYGYELKASAIAVADELAAAGELVMGKIDQVPVALIRGYTYVPAPGDGHTLIRDSATDMFR
jgi:coenzyme F420-0:L-glutamate ligase / coenzyme F420-1:gamma-L-glutamate ligase